MYHDVVENGFYDRSGRPGGFAATYKLDRDDFSKHLDAIREAIGGAAVGLVDRPDSWKNPQLVFLTFDDGGASAHTVVADMLESRGWRGHFFITTDWIGRPGFLKLEEIRELRQRGHVVGSHSCSHPTRMSRCSWDQLVQEWGESIRVLSDILDEPVVVASVPGGDHSRRVAEAAAFVGIQRLFTSEPTTASLLVDDCVVLGRYAIRKRSSPRLSGALAAGEWVPRWEQRACWYLKRSARSVAGPLYVRLQEALFNR